MPAPPSSRLPLLAIPHTGLSLPVMTSAQAAAGVCSILWLVDGDDPLIRAERRALDRFGLVVDLAGIAPKKWADAVGPFRPDGMMTFSDQRMVDLAHLAENLDLPFHSPGTALRLTDKAAQREALRRGGLPVPGSTVLGGGLDDDALHHAVVDVRFPAVLKPVRGNDSRTTVLVEDATEVATALASLFHGHRPDMTLEEYLADTAPCLGESFANYLSVESVVRAGVIEHFAVTGRFPLAPPFRETGFFVPADLTPRQRTAVKDTATRAVRAMGVETGCLHTEIKFTPDGPRVIEVNGRLGGGVPLMLEMATGASAPRLAMQVALGQPVDVCALVPKQAIGYRLLFHAPLSARRVLSVEGLDEISRLPGAPAATLHRPPGTEIDWRTGTNDYVYAVVGVAHSYDELRTVAQGSKEMVRMEFGSARPSLSAVLD